MTSAHPSAIPWAVRAEILAHDFTEREKDVLQVLLLNSLDLGLPAARIERWRDWTGRRDDEERRILADLAAACVLTYDGECARILPDTTAWKIRRKIPAPAAPGSQQLPLDPDSRPLDGALAATSHDRASYTLSGQIDRLCVALTAAPGPDPPAKVRAKSQAPTAVAEALAQAHCDHKLKAKAEASVASPHCENADAIRRLGIEVRRAIGDRAWDRYREWRQLTETQPETVRRLLRILRAAEAEASAGKGRDIASPGAYMSHIARAEGTWPTPARPAMPA